MRICDSKIIQLFKKIIKIKKESMHAWEPHKICNHRRKKRERLIDWYLIFDTCLRIQIFIRFHFGYTFDSPLKQSSTIHFHSIQICRSIPNDLTSHDFQFDNTLSTLLPSLTLFLSMNTHPPNSFLFLSPELSSLKFSNPDFSLSLSPIN